MSVITTVTSLVNLNPDFSTNPEIQDSVKSLLGGRVYALVWGRSLE